MKRPNSTNKRTQDNLLQNLYKAESKSFISGRRNSKQNRKTPPKKPTHRALIQKPKLTNNNVKDISFSSKYNPN